MIWLTIGSLTMTILAGLHSYIGETRLLQQLLARPDLPVLQGSVDYTKAIIRWAWHLTSVAWLGFAAIFIGLTQTPSEGRQILLMILTGVLGLSGIVAFTATRGRHLAWVFFLIAAICAWMGAR
jgi:hypothetical protein